MFYGATVAQSHSVLKKNESGMGGYLWVGLLHANRIALRTSDLTLGRARARILLDALKSQARPCVGRACLPREEPGR